MKWDEQLNKAIEYIEANLEGQIDFDEVAQIMCQSKISFQRSFSLIMNISIHDYIRRRRMTLAAIELRNSPIKIIDLALKFGYESPVSFTRSFKEIHEVSPSAARKNDVRLNLFPRITCLLTVKGVTQMDYVTENMNHKEVNWKGFDWQAWKTPNLSVYDNTVAMAHMWKDAGHKNLLDLGTGLGQNALYFAKQGFDVSAIDISDYGISHLLNWAASENLAVNAKVGDMHSLPFDDNSFDCLFAYHVISHSDSAGVKKIIAEIERVLKSGGDAYLTFCSKETTVYMEGIWPRLDNDTLISQTEAEKGIPHFYADYDDICMLLANFDIGTTKHTEYCFPGDDNGMRYKFYYVNARACSH